MRKIIVPSRYPLEHELESRRVEPREFVRVVPICALICVLIYPIRCTRDPREPARGKKDIRLPPQRRILDVCKGDGSAVESPQQPDGKRLRSQYR